MAQIELDSCPDDDPAIALWQRATDSGNPTFAAQAWLNLGRSQQHSAPITAAHAFEQAMLAVPPAIDRFASVTPSSDSRPAPVEPVSDSGSVDPYPYVEAACYLARILYQRRRNPDVTRRTQKLTSMVVRAADQEVDLRCLYGALRGGRTVQPGR